MEPYESRPTGRRRGLRAFPRGQLRERLAARRTERPEPRERQFPPRIAVPSFFTLLNLFCGFLAIVQISEGRMDYAAWLIVMAGFFDLLDGMMARLASATSDFGIELDSLADVVSFGVAPSFLVYSNGLNTVGPLGLIISALPAICGAVRLARYNVFAEAEKKDYFNGLPIPAQAAALVAFILAFDDPSWYTAFERGRLSVLIPVVILLSTLMVTSIRFDAIPQPNRAYLRSHRVQVILFCVGLLAVLFFQEEGLFVSMFVYVLYGLTRAFWNGARTLLMDDE